MSVQTKATPDITRAAERYLEQYGDPLVMNTYLKVTILCLVVVCLALATLVYRSQRALVNSHPMIVRIDDVGHAEAIDYRNFQYRPQEAENKYYLTRWAELYFSRNRFTIERDQTSALYFLNSDVQRAVIEQERKDNIILTYRNDSTLPYVDVEVKNVVLDDLRVSPYSARIEFEKVFTNPADHTELKRERWTASVTYVFRENVKNNELAVNPLGLTIVRFRADQALTEDESTIPEAFHVVLCRQSGCFPLPVPVHRCARHPERPDLQQRWRVARLFWRTYQVESSFDCGGLPQPECG